jgi:hypothetical protein
MRLCESSSMSRSTARVYPLAVALPGAVPGAERPATAARRRCGPAPGPRASGFAARRQPPTLRVAHHSEPKCRLPPTATTEVPGQARNEPRLCAWRTKGRQNRCTRPMTGPFCLRLMRLAQTAAPNAKRSGVVRGAAVDGSSGLPRKRHSAQEAVAVAAACEPDQSEHGGTHDGEQEAQPRDLRNGRGVGGRSDRRRQTDRFGRGLG